MNEFFSDSVFFGVALTLFAYGVGLFVQSKCRLAVCNPLLLAIVLVIAFLTATGTKYETYEAGARYLGYLLTPATVCLAIPLYERLQLLRRNWKAVLAGIFSGVVTSLLTVLAGCLLFGLSKRDYITLLPKSVTTAIGMDISGELGGYVSLTVAAIIVTGIFGNMIAEQVFRLFGIREPVAKGVALGTSAHAMGTARAMQMGETEGAMGSLSIAVAGLLTVIGASLFAQLY